ncbi:protein ACCELERATED CELL DEATH 6-like [Silene latifolia]|uniref:protein ACCELERATED CELL DEATH 6-like n=1 Tax=Silene latifolia TaxID=37657 RepID=UPI003D7711F2
MNFNPNFNPMNFNTNTNFNPMNFNTNTNFNPMNFNPNLPLRMDFQLEKAASEGNVVFLKNAFDSELPPVYFLAQADGNGSILDIAAENMRVEFMKEAVNILPQSIIKKLLRMRSFPGNTLLLHRAACSNNIAVIKCITEMYASFSWDNEGDHFKPWLALTDNNQTPLDFAMHKHSAHQECMIEILLADPQLERCTFRDRQGHTPIYYALIKGLNLVAEKIVMSPVGPASLLSQPDFSTLFTKHSDNVVSLLKKCGYLDNDGNTPLHSVLQSTSTQELALQKLLAYPGLCKFCNNRGESPFFLAVKCGYEQVVDEIMRIDEPRFQMLRRNDGTTVLHNLSACPETTGVMVLEKYWWLMNLQDDKKKTALDYAKQKNADWLVNLLANPSLIKNKQDFDWMEACKKDESEALLAFIHNCQDLHRVCLKGKDTLLHHVKLPTYEDYQYFLKIPSIAKLKNMTDDQGATPLHCALKRKDMQFAKALLSDNHVNRTVRDHFDETTSMDLLAKLCTEHADWEGMCKQINVNPYVRTIYIQPGTNLEQMRNTLSVIAALLATITFAAGFALPGGINSNNGEALLSKKAAFLVFLLADAYAMCTSMLVLFFLVWSMVSKLDMAQVLVDRSVFILTQSLYGTLLAFITGVYTVIEHSSLWAAIVIFVMCSIIGILANKTILHLVISLIISGTDRE